MDRGPSSFEPRAHKYANAYTGHMTETALGNRDILVKIWWSVWAVGLMNFLGLLGIVIVLADR